MSVGQASWLTVIGVCLIATVILAVDGYAGYSIVIAAVGIAAATNIL